MFENLARWIVITLKGKELDGVIIFNDRGSKKLVNKRYNIDMI